MGVGVGVGFGVPIVKVADTETSVPAESSQRARKECDPFPAVPGQE
ncbi:hypothetical protein ACQP1W_44805 [Spirillospora sp. CA-255316]